jgi:hypothetical protein
MTDYEQMTDNEALKWSQMALEHLEKQSSGAAFDDIREARDIVRGISKRYLVQQEAWERLKAMPYQIYYCGIESKWVCQHISMPKDYHEAATPDAAIERAWQAWKARRDEPLLR